MNRLYTPWRWDYIVNPKPSNCPFCDYLQQDPEHDSDNYILYRGRHAFIMLNAYPYSNGHVMVLPKAHVSMLADTDIVTQAEMMALTTYCTTLLGRAYNAQGFNVGINLGKAAGAGMEPHLHIHIVPRWEGDTNFMPVIGRTQVLPEMLDDSYQRLHRLLTQFPPPTLDGFKQE